jgi:diaminohydroxyphosphoribosylaminopyrimidine deaminase/5-amino-6-(5-phosphoribosylamino)uracil reductase
MNETNNYMNSCLELAKQAIGQTYPNPLVGCVIVSNGKIISKGFHKKAGEHHAEKDAIYSLLGNGEEIPEGSDLYVNLEPCCHHGRTAPCTDLIIEKKFKNVYVGMLDPNPLVAGKGIKQLEDAGIKTQVGILEAECQLINRSFVKNITKKETYFSLKAAITLDGLMADRNNKSKWITGPESRQKVHQLRSQHDGILVGIKTIRADNPSLNTRTKENQKQQKIIIVDKELEFDLNSKVVSINGVENISVLTTSTASKEKKSKLEEQGIRVITHPVENNYFDKLLGKTLFGHGYCNLLVEAGPSLISSLINNQMADELHLFTAPIFLGTKNSHQHISKNLDLSSLDDALKPSVISREVFGVDQYTHLVF